ncbi:MAG: proline--tRNA ligase [Candidatus Omnitrophica bacterium]|nr:proline--tRNA ligase [Candidatus Omnitrophota bacterium]
MLWTKTFIPTLKEAPQEADSISHKLLLRAGLMRMLMSGVYTYLPLGLRVLNNIENIIRQEMDSSGAAELLLPALQPLELWLKTGRDKDLGETMIRFTDRRGRKICLGPTHEEVITDLVKGHVSSYKQLPLVLYQIQTKFRDELRPRFGPVRACEFVMKDAYSFDRDQEGLEKNYKIMLAAYNRIFGRMGLDFLVVEADAGVMGGSVSHEFMVPTESGEDVVLACPKCHCALPYKEEVADKKLCPKCNEALVVTNTVEIGHIFQLGTKYSSSLGANFLDASGKLQPIIMGCYGIGVSRLISAVIEQNHDDAGIIWPDEVSPYRVIVVPLDITDEKISGCAHAVYQELNNAGVQALLDDRDERAGVKFKDADLLGIPLEIIIGKEFLKTGNLELKFRRENKKITGDKEDILKHIR